MLIHGLKIIFWSQIEIFVFTVDPDPKISVSDPTACDPKLPAVISYLYPAYQIHVTTMLPVS